MRHKRGEYLAIGWICPRTDYARDTAFKPEPKPGDRVRFRGDMSQGFEHPPVLKGTLGTVLSKRGGWSASIRLDDDRVVNAKYYVLEILRVIGAPS